jgi:hypothetical protein
MATTRIILYSIVMNFAVIGCALFTNPSEKDVAKIIPKMIKIDNILEFKSHNLCFIMHMKGSISSELALSNEEFKGKMDNFYQGDFLFFRKTSILSVVGKIPPHGSILNEILWQVRGCLSEDIKNKRQFMDLVDSNETDVILVGGDQWKFIPILHWNGQFLVFGVGL